MKKYKFIFLLLIIVFSLVLVSCKNNEEDPEPQPEPEEKQLTLEHTDILIYEGETFTLQASLEGGLEGTITWSTEDEDVATVVNGVVSAVAEGTTVVTASIAEYFAVCTVKVNKEKELSFPFTERKLQVGRTTQLLPQFIFKGQEVTDKEFTWTVSDEKIATVDEEGYITALKAGKTTVTVESDSLQTAFELEVVNNISLSINVRKKVLNPNENDNRSVVLDITVKKNGVTVRSPIIVWKSLDEAIVRLTSNAGRAAVTAYGTGNTAVVGEYDGEIITCQITSYKTLRTPQDFEMMRNDFLGWYKLMNNVDFTGYSWTCISPWQGDNAPDESYFGGIFDGQGYTISNVNFYANWHQAIFGQINRYAVVKNVSLVNAVHQKTSNMTGSMVALNYGLMENIYVEVTIQADSNSMYNSTGGLAALNADTGVIRNCVVKVTASKAYKNVGALVGYNWATMYNCYAVCTDAKLPAVYTYHSEYGSMDNCYAFADEESLYDESYYYDFDKTVWTVTGYDLPALKYFPQVSFPTDNTYLTVGKTYKIDPLNVKGIPTAWKFDRDYQDLLDIEYSPDGSIYVTPTQIGTIFVEVSLENGSKATTNLVAKRITLLAENDNVHLDYNNPGLSNSQLISMVDEFGQSIANEDMSFITSNPEVATVSEDGTITAHSGGTAYISMLYDGDTYENLIKVNVTPWIQVSTPADLNNMRNNFTANYCLVNDIDYQGNTFDPIAPWDGYDGPNYHFAGVFDGNGYTISNLKILAGRDTAGIWGQTAETSIIRNTNFVNIIGPDDRTTSFGVVGLNEGIIENVYVEMTITVGGILDYKAGGGIVGTNEFRGTVTNCIAVVNVESLNEGTFYGSIAGLNQGLIENCFSVIYGAGRNRVDRVSFENGTTLTSRQYSANTKTEAITQAINGEAPFGSFNSKYWQISGKALPSLKKLTR